MLGAVEESDAVSVCSTSHITHEVGHAGAAVLLCLHAIMFLRLTFLKVARYNPSAWCDQLSLWLGITQMLRCMCELFIEDLCHADTWCCLKGLQALMAGLRNSSNDWSPVTA